MRTGSRDVASRSLGIIVSGATPIHFYPLVSGSVNPGYWKESTIYYTLTQSIYSLLENLAPALQGIAIKLAL